jgi:hypothetical protein
MIDFNGQWRKIESEKDVEELKIFAAEKKPSALVIAPRAASPKAQCFAGESACSIAVKNGELQWEGAVDSEVFGLYYRNEPVRLGDWFLLFPAAPVEALEVLNGCVEEEEEQ